MRYCEGLSAKVLMGGGEWLNRSRGFSDSTWRHPYLVRYPQRTVDRLMEWTRDPNPPGSAVRRRLRGRSLETRERGTSGDRSGVLPDVNTLRFFREATRAPLLCAFLGACGGSGSDIAGPVDTTFPPASGPSDPTALTSGSFRLPAANAFGEPGFHAAFRINATLPDTLGATTGLTLVLALRDLTRPTITCSAPHPTSGCATVDWDDFPGRPATPADGLFLNRLRVATVGGTRDYFLRKTLAMEDDPEPGPPT